MLDPRIPRKNPWVAAVLALVWPGAGHLYQGRFFKAALYMVCILGMFCYGLRLGEGKVVYYEKAPGRTTYGYYAQVLVGLPAWPALWQSRRFQDPDNFPETTLDDEIEAPFSGRLFPDHARSSDVEGTLLLRPTAGSGGRRVRGRFIGKRGEEKLELELAGPVRLAPPIEASRQRNLLTTVVDENGEQIGEIVGGIPRPFHNWFQVPLQEHELQAVNGRLGKLFELALVYTWIAGLLNILAIWDAFEGPAYGYGDEPEEKTKKPAAKASETSAEPEAPTDNANPRPERTPEPATTSPALQRAPQSKR